MLFWFVPDPGVTSLFVFDGSRCAPNTEKKKISNYFPGKFQNQNNFHPTVIRVKPQDYLHCVRCVLNYIFRIEQTICTMVASTK